MKGNALMSVPVVEGKRALGAAYKEDAAHLRDSNFTVKRFMKHAGHVSIGIAAETAWHAAIKDGAGWCAVLDNGKCAAAVEIRKISREYR